MGVQAIFCCFNQRRMVCQTQVVVGTKVNNVVTALGGYVGLLLGGDHPLYFIQPILTGGVKLLFEMRNKRC